MAEAERPGGPARPVSEESLDHLLEAVFEDESAERTEAETGLADTSPHDRFRVLGRLARGDGADVLLAHDRGMDREVALKVLRAGPAGDETAYRRFLERAQSGAQLRHPSIVPVYGLGVGEDGRPFYAMKLVDGRPLADLVERVDRHRLLAVLEPVARAVAYAHARQVVHGDLDPSNVLVGAFGQVHLVGWNGASAGPDGDIRALGALLGTVRGQDDRLDEMASRCSGDDPPTAAEVALAVGDVQRRQEARAREAETAGARARAEAEEQRTAEALARRRAVGARHARRRALVVAAIVLLAVVLGGGALLVSRVEHAAAADRVAAEAAAAMREADRLAAVGDWSESEGWARKAAALASPEKEAAAGALLARVVEARAFEAASAALLGRLDEALLAQTLEWDPGTLHRAYLEAFLDAGYDVEGEDPERLGARLARRADAADLGAHLDTWWLDLRPREGEEPAAAGTDWRHLLRVVRAADPDPWRNELRDAFEHRDWDGLPALAAKADAGGTPAQTLRLAARALLQLQRPDEAIRLLADAGRRRPVDLRLEVYLFRALMESGETSATAALERLCSAWVAARPDRAGAWLNLSMVLLRREDLSGAAAAARRAVALDPDSASGWVNLGVALGVGDESIAAFRRAHELDPDRMSVLANLANSLCSMGHLDEAEVFCDKLMERRPALAWSYLAMVRLRQGRREEAREACRKSLRLDDRSPITWAKLGGILVVDLLRAPRSARPARAREARLALERAIRLPRIVSLDGHGIRGSVQQFFSPIELAGAHANLSQLLRTFFGDLPGALREAEGAVRIDPESAVAQNALGTVRLALRDFRGAEEPLRRAAELDPDQGEARSNLGLTLLALGRPAEAIGPLREAVALDGSDPRFLSNLASGLHAVGRRAERLEVLEKAVRVAPDDPGSWHNLGSARHDAGDRKGCEEAYRKAAELAPGSARTWANLGVLLFQGGEHEESLSLARKALRLDQRCSTAWGLLANLHLQRREMDEAAAAARQAATTSFMPQEKAIAEGRLGWIESVRGRYPEAIAALRRAIELEPGASHPYPTLAWCLARTGKYREAIEAYRTAIRMNYPDPALPARYARLLTDCPDETLRDAKEAERIALAVTRKIPSAAFGWSALGAAWYRLGKYAEALAAFDEERRRVPQEYAETAFDGLYRAMALHGLGRLDEARKHLEASVRWMEAQAPDDPDLKRLRAEAEALIGKIEEDGK